MTVLEEIVSKALKASSIQTATYLNSHLFLWVLINQGDYSWKSEIANGSLRWGEGTWNEKREVRADEDGRTAMEHIRKWSSCPLPSAWPRVFTPVWKEGCVSDVSWGSEVLLSHIQGHLWASALYGYYQVNLWATVSEIPHYVLENSLAAAIFHGKVAPTPFQNIPAFCLSWEHLLPHFPFCRDSSCGVL